MSVMIRIEGRSAEILPPRPGEMIDRSALWCALDAWMHANPGAFLVEPRGSHAVVTVTDSGMRQICAAVAAGENGDSHGRDEESCDRSGGRSEEHTSELQSREN